MTDTYTKLFSSITESTIWSEPAGTRLVWITLLAKCNRHGQVYGSVPGLARLANVTLDECVVALETFRAPDPWSRTPDNDGRRIEDIEGGWRLLNFAKFDRMRSEAEAAERERERKREWDRQHRPSGHARAAQSDDSPTTVRQESDAVRAPTNTSSISKSKEQKLSAQPAASRFGDWWAVYPKKVGKKPAEQKWRSRGLDVVADALIADVQYRAANDDGWLRGYVPDPTTYLNQDRWEDDLRTAPVARAGPAAPSKVLTAIQRLEGMKNGLAGKRAADGVPETALLGFGPDPGR